MYDNRVTNWIIIIILTNNITTVPKVQFKMNGQLE